ncbi:hypothetical protein CRE_23440 [Caenorhabditis remanei]|uniref:DUF38 domain-containing protein n=1 Tax=Caenorhabditis remanei TaxID=31234 RepID=E3MGS2_CAERE|nr:hypothetical protein CRE_23440 [Caenorhabditis remanei]
MTSPLLLLPGVTMDHILYFCDYLEIARLRNVCHSLRNHIDLFKPDAHVKEVRLGNWENAEICFESENESKNNSRIWIGYKEAHDGCTVACKTHMGSTPLKTISGLDPMDALMQDFKIYLRHLKTPLIKFKLDEICCDPLLQIMRSQTFKLKTNKLQLCELSTAQILAILRFFDANCLKNLKIFTDVNDVTGEPLGVFHELFETEYWRNAEKIRLSNFYISDVRQISHLKKFEGCMSTATIDDLVFLKNTFIRLTGFEWIHINFDVDFDVPSINEAFGAPSFDIEFTNSWFFRIHNDTSVLWVELTDNEVLVIERVDRSDIPPGAVVINY